MSAVEKLTQKEKELVAVAASIASGCMPCTMHHIKAVREAGASEAEVLGAIGIALDVRDNATEMMAEAAQGSLNYEYPGKAPSGSMEQPIDDLVAIGAALACNSVAGLEYHLTLARAAGVSTSKIQTAMGIARSIRKSAAEKVDVRIRSLIEPIQGKAENAERQKESVPPPCGCSKKSIMKGSTYGKEVTNNSRPVPPPIHKCGRQARTWSRKAKRCRQLGKG